MGGLLRGGGSEQAAARVKPAKAKGAAAVGWMGDMKSYWYQIAFSCQNFTFLASQIIGLRY